MNAVNRTELLHLHQAGPRGSGRTPVVLLHGLGSCWQDWGLQLPALWQRWWTLAVDLGGHGRSGPATSRLSIGAMAADLAATLRAYRVRTANLVGLSLGAAVGLQFGVDYPERTRSLILVNGFAHLGLMGGSRWTALGRLYFALTGQMDKLGNWVARSLFPEEGQGELRTMAARRVAANQQGSYLRAIWALARFDLRRRLAEVLAPSLVVAGLDDPIVPLAAKQRLAQGLPRAELATVPNSGHATPIDQADRFNELMLGFLRRVEALAPSAEDRR